MPSRIVKTTHVLRQAGAIAAAATLTLALMNARANPGGESSPAEPPPPTAEARKLIDKGRWRDAIAELQRVNQPKNAEWNNLMGYAHRKLEAPDLDAAQRYYDAALGIDPKHRGALEYSGELYLMKNDVASAKKRLEQLEAACGNKRCEEYRDLEVAIGKHEAKAPVAR